MAARRKAAKLQQLQQVSEVAATDGTPDEEMDDTDALVMAAMQGNGEALETLLDSTQIDVNHKDSIGVAPLHWAAFCGHVSVCQRLLDANADMHVRDREGRTPLHVAAYENQTDCLRLLIGVGAELHSPDKVGWTPLHCAVSNSIERACLMLTEAGADALAKDAEGKSSMDLAHHFGNQRVVSILEGAQEQRELLALKGMGIGSRTVDPASPHPPRESDPSRSPNSVDSPLALN